MGEVCRRCGGKGERWTGRVRVACGQCGGSGGRELPTDQRRPDGPVRPDPIRSAR